MFLSYCGAEPLHSSLAPVDSNDTAPGLETESDEGVYRATLSFSLRLKRCIVTADTRANIAQLHSSDHDHPSPGDDITCAALGAMDQA